MQNSRSSGALQQAYLGRCARQKAKLGFALVPATAGEVFAKLNLITFNLLKAQVMGQVRII